MREPAGSVSAVLLGLCLAGAAACHRQAPTASRTEVGAGPPAAPTGPPDAAAAPPAPAAPPFEVRSLRLKRSAPAYVEPDDKSRVRGTIAQGTRLAVGQQRAGRGCDSGNVWALVMPDAWVCDRWLEPSPEEPRGDELPRLPKGQLLPAEFAQIDLPRSMKKAAATQPAPGAVPPTPTGYASVKDILADKGRPTGGAWKCALLKPPLKVKGTKYWRTDCGLIFETKYVRPYRPPEFAGVMLDEAKLTLPVVFVSLPKAETTSRPEGGRTVKSYPGRTALRVLEVKVIARRGRDRPPRRAYRVGPSEWLSSTRGNLAETTPPPAGLRPAERWVDVNTDEQVLVAYEGERPVFATLVSTGKEKVPPPKEPTPTTPGVYRIYHKFAETKMSGLPGTDESYYVSKVPWTEYFSGDLALHGAYWHNGFGRVASHGCVNLTPKDARFLYSFTDPQVPPGWTMIAGSTQHPGSIVRVHNAKEPTPRLQGYAKRVLQLRKGEAAAAAPGEPTEAPAIPSEPDESARGTP